MTLLTPRIIGIVAFLIVVVLLVSLAQEMNRRLQVQREVVKLEQQVQEMERSVIELENLNQYFRTDDFRERIAREKLNYLAPGEKAVLIPHTEIYDGVPNQADEAETAPSIPEQWWRVFFVPDTSTT